ncbi:MAG: glycosyltransferase, partial [Bacteroidaceae bacterium]|nr:glycosyltransferase [Bacteroidaceae bacterium]
TYIKNILTLVRDERLAFHVVQLNADVTEVTTQTMNGIEGITIPAPTDASTQAEDYYDNAARILRNYVDLTAENIFHLNFLGMSAFAKAVKQHLNAKIVLTIHYSQATLNLKGDVEKLYKIIRRYDKADKSNDDTISPFYQEAADIRLMSEKYADAVISVSQHAYMRNKLLCQTDNDKHRLIYNTVKDLYPNGKILKRVLRKNLGIGINERIIVYAGRLDETKGVQCLLQALAILKKRGRRFHLFIAGEGNYNATLSFASDLWTNITFAGFLEKGQLYKLLAASDIGVCPSLYDEFGYVILEMMMFNLPVVAFNTSGPADIIEDKRTGLLADLAFDDANRSIESLTEKIDSLLSNSQKRIRMGRNGRKRYLTRFSTNVFKKEMTSLYNGL